MPIISLTFDNIKIRCLIDTGSETSILTSSVLGKYPEEELCKTLFFSTLNGILEVKTRKVTPIPEEFKISGTLSWKIMNLSCRKYDAIIGQNFLIPLKAKINLEDGYIQVNNTKIYLENNSNPFIINEICNLESGNLEKLNLDHLNSIEKGRIMRILKEYQNLFYKEGSKLTFTHEVQHEIITNTSNPIYSKIYRYPRIHEKEIERQIEEMLEQNIIQHSNSPYNSPLWIVPKKIDNSGEQKWRIVIDYRKLNDVTISDKFPIPNIESILDKLGRAQYFTSLDLAKGFHQILVKNEDRKKTAFSTPFGHYEYVRMPFGLKNAPATFQRLMNSVLRDYINKICVVYLDDILIFSTSLEEHMDSIKKVFNKLKDSGLKIQIDKCNFLKKETEYLGHILTPQGVKPNPNKIKVIQDLKLPSTVKQIKQFLGITGFYRKFIKDYAKIAHPITKYLKKGAKINKNDPNYISAFAKLKEIITEHPILRYPDFSKRFKLITDASNFALGAVLTQNGHPVCYASRTLNDHEKNYSTIEKELLAIVWGTKYFRPYLFGKEFDLQTDHQPIKWLHAKYAGKDINPRLQRWLVSLGEYDIKIDYIKGKDNKIADFLSRINTETNDINLLEIDDLNIDLNETFQNHSEEINAIDESIELQTAHSQEENFDDYIPILDTIVNRFKTQIILKESKERESETYFGKRRIFIDKQDMENGNSNEILRRYISKGRIGIYSELNDHEYNKLQKVIIDLYSGNRNIKFLKCTFFASDIEDEEELNKQISLFHKNESGHSGIVATYESIKNRIYNPHLKIAVYQIINNCDICAEAKYDRNPIRKKFHFTETPSTTNEIVHVDTYVNSKHPFIVFIDKFSKHAVCFYLEDRNSQTIIEKLRQYISIKGKIKKFVFDNEFNTIKVKEFCSQEQIEYHLTKPNNHTGNSDIERLNNTITERIRVLNLEEKLPIKTQIIKAITLYNNSYHSTIKATPLEVQEHKIDHQIIKDRIEKTKHRIINKRNEKREDYTENREEGFIKNYKSVRHKEEPKFKRHKLKNIHENNIKRPFKFSVTANDGNTNPDGTPNSTNTNTGRN